MNNLRDSVRTVVDEVYLKITLNPIELEEHFKSVKDVLIIRSASLKIFSKLVQTLKSVNPSIFFHIITHARDSQDVRSICGDCEIYEYNHGGKYELSRMTDILEKLEQKRFDRYVVLYNNKYGMGYENSEEIVTAIANDKIYAFNSYWQMFRINDPSLHISSLRLFTALCDWYWEYMEGAEETPHV